MPRNLERRVELMFPVLDEKISFKLIDMLNDYFRDNCQASILDNKGKWKRITSAEGERVFRVQKEMLSLAARAGENPGPVKLEYNVRRSPPQTA
jgi:polyphosphate kinase